MLRKAIPILLIIVPLHICSSCDDGDIYPEPTGEATGRKATLTARFSGLDAWPEAYQLVFAGFGDDEHVPDISKMIQKPATPQEEVTLTMSGIADNVKTLSVSVITNGRELLHHYYTYNAEESTGDIVLPELEIDVAEYPRIQEQVFDNYCAACHGAGNTAAAGLYLTEGRSYEALVNRTARLGNGKLLVKPGSTGESFLMDILENDILGYNHTDVLPEQELITLIGTWIRNGCANEDKP